MQRGNAHRRRAPHLKPHLKLAGRVDTISYGPAPHHDRTARLGEGGAIVYLGVDSRIYLPADLRAGWSGEACPARPGLGGATRRDGAPDTLVTKRPAITHCHPLELTQRSVPVCGESFPGPSTRPRS